MAEVTYSESSYRFFDPIRLYRDHDWYVADVDNIPIKQLHSNTLWLKDQLDKAMQIQKVSRGDFDELRPYVTETDNKVRVKPGRFTARINDVYNRIRLARIVKIVSRFEFGRIPAWMIYTYSDATTTNTALKSNIDKINSVVGNEALFMNGLMERAFTYPTRTPSSPFTDFRNATYRGLGIQLYAPIEEYIGWRNPQNNSVSADLGEAFLEDERGFAPLSYIESAFIKFWRGVTRLAVVDVPSELELEVPAFRDSDFDYIDANGNRVEVTDGTHRIDMVFIYSKPIDDNNVTIAKRVNGVNQNISSPQLGLIRGAGLIADLSDDSYTPNQLQATSRFDDLALDSDGNIQIKASVADQKNTTGGFSLSSIYGSFPSEDLANIAPLLAEELAANDPALIGQTILPVAYIVVRKSASTTSSGKPILTTEDLVDIRPFFRTAELTYNERAGIAAARPQISIANPVVGKVELAYESRRIFNQMNDLETRLRSTNTNQYPRPVGLGYVFGGLNFGVEGVIADYIKQNVNRGATTAELQNLIKSRKGYFMGANIPESPDWDLSKWAMSYDDPGFYPNDYINTFFIDNGTIKYAAYEDSGLSDKLIKFGTDNVNGRSLVCIHFVKKTIPIDKSEVSWMYDYFVHAQLLGCVPLTARSNAKSTEQAAGAAGVWVDKGPTSFTIYCAWVANDFIQSGDESRDLSRDSSNWALPYVNRDSASKFAAWAVLVDDFMTDTSQGNYRVPGGVALYPSITFEVIGVPRSYPSMYSAGTGTLRLT